jgi:hypothetical protein
VDLQGCAGSSIDRKTDKLRVVTSDKQITVLEARRIEELGYNGPDSHVFKSCVKIELGINDKNEKKL